MSDTIKPCPFCGDDIPQLSRHIYHDEGKREGWWVLCTNCSIMTPERNTKELAIAAWNRRSSPRLEASARVLNYLRTIPLKEVGEFLDKKNADLWAMDMEELGKRLAALDREKKT